MTPPDRSEVLDWFRRSGALLHGHFVLRSGLHSREFFQCALLLRDTGMAAKVCGLLAASLDPATFDTVISPALGGLIVGHEVARQTAKPHIFAEKDEAGGLVLRRGFSIRAGERFVVAEDVVTRGGRLLETVELVRRHGGLVVAAVCIVDRSGGRLPPWDFDFSALVQLEVETFAADRLPPDLAGIPAVKPGSK